MSKKTIQWPTDPRWWKTRQTGQVAEELGCHRNAAYRHRINNNLPSPPFHGGPGAPQRVQDSLIDLNRDAEWNAKKQNCGVAWMKIRMDRLRKAMKRQQKAVKPKAAKPQYDW